MTDHTCLSFTADDPVAARLGLGAAALRYQQMGYAVLPLATAAKKPHRMLPDAPPGHGGVYWATRDPRMPWWAWAQDKAAGVGIATGQASQLVVVDLDVKGLHNGKTELGRFMLENQLDIPMDAVARTPSGGWHIWLRSGEWQVPQRLGILPGVDIKGDGGYVVAAPTMISQPTLDGETVLLPYDWAQGCPCSVPEAPGWLFEWIASAPASMAEIAGGGSAGPAVDLDQLRETGLEQGSRNAGLYRLACSLYARYGTDPDGQAAVAGAVAEVLAKTDRRDFGQREVATILASARMFVSRSRERDAEMTEAARRWLTR
jgi:hypothetical protein